MFILKLYSQGTIQFWRCNKIRHSMKTQFTSKSIGTEAPNSFCASSTFTSFGYANVIMVIDSDTVRVGSMLLKVSFEFVALPLMLVASILIPSSISIRGFSSIIDLLRLLFFPVAVHEDGAAVPPEA